MEKSNFRTLYHIEGTVNNLHLTGEVATEASKAFTFNGNVDLVGTEKTGWFTYSDRGDGNVSYNWNGNKEIEDAAKALIDSTVENDIVEAE